MAFKKGTSGNPTGKPKGSQNKTNKELKSLVSEFVSTNWHQVQKDFENKKLHPRDRLNFMERVLRYVIPVMGTTNGKLEIKQIENMSDADFEKLVAKIIEMTSENNIEEQ